MKTVHVVRLGSAAAALHSYLREHDDGETSWTSEVRSALPFLSADAARRYAARRLGGDWHVVPVDRAGYRRLIVDEAEDEVDSLPETDAGVEAAWSRLVPSASILTPAEGEALVSRRRKKRAVSSASTPEVRQMAILTGAEPRF